MRSEKTLRFGVMCDGYIFKKWQEICIKKIMEISGCELQLLILNTHAQQNTGADSQHHEQGLASPRHNLLRKFQRKYGNIYNIVTRKYVHPESFVDVDLTWMFEGIPLLSCSTYKTDQYSEYFTDADLASIERYNLDFILRFGFNIIRGDILKVSKYGVWSYHHDDEQLYRGRPPCFWEIYNNDDVSGAVLQRLTDRLDGGVPLRKGKLRTVNWSYSANIDKVFFESSKWAAHVCEDILEGNDAYLFGEASTTQAPIYKAPNNWQMIYFLGRIFWNKLRVKLRSRLLREHWNIGVIDSSIRELVNNLPRTDAEWLSDPSRQFFRADPFPIKIGKSVYLFHEEFEQKLLKGRIMVSKWEDSSAKGTHILESHEHASYPFVFELDGTIYCVPETDEHGVITIYQTDAGLTRWSKAKTIECDHKGIDPTVFFYADRWWLACTTDEGPESHLALYFAFDLLGEWYPHKSNPVKIDISSARPAGSTFRIDDHLYRPAQDCAKTYGGRVVINRIDDITPWSFHETLVAWIEPDQRGPYPAGLHTVNSVGERTWIDGKKHVLNLGQLIKFNAVKKLSRSIVSTL